MAPKTANKPQGKGSSQPEPLPRESQDYYERSNSTNAHSSTRDVF